MSKMDAMRALREARYAETTPRAAKPAKVPTVKTKASAPAATDAAAPGAELCGHRNIGSRTCTRAKGHAEKSHRYS